MIEAILKFSLRQRALIVLLALALIGFGLYSATQLPIDAVPDLTNRQVQINAVAPALGAEEVERQITFPLEVALAGLPYLVETRSISQFGLSQITVVFRDDTDLYFARQLVSQRLEGVKEQLPPGVHAEMGPVSSGLGEIYYIRLDNPDLSLMERRTLMDWVVRPALLSVPGLAEVNTWGGEVRQVQVQIDPDRLRAYGFTVPDVLEAVSESNQNAGGAYLRRGPEQQVVRGIGTLRGPEDIRKVVLGSHEGTPVTVEQVAQVSDAPMVRQGAITAEGRGEAVYAINMLLIGENGRIVVERVKDRVRTIEKSLPAGSQLVGFLDRSALIERTLRTAMTNLIEGGLLVIVVLFLFLLQMRAGLIVSSVIPLSMLIAVIGMRYFGVSANLMSLGAIDFGLIVDGAVILVENSVRRLTEERQLHGRELTEEERRETIYAATLQVRRASQFGEMIIIAAYLPILSLTGIEGKMFRPMGLTVIFALLGALLLSFTLVPALCALFLRVREERRNPVVHLLEMRYRPLLEWTLGHKWLPLTVAAGLLVVSISLFGRLGSEFLPKLDEGAVAVEAMYLPSISLEEVVERATVAERHIKAKFPDEVKELITRIGRPEVATDPMLVNQTDILIDLTPRDRWKKARTKDELVAKMAEELEKLPGVATGMTQPIQMRTGEILEGVGQRSDLAIKLYGADPEILAAEAAKIAAVIQKTPGAADVRTETTEGLPQLQIRLDRDAIARYGVRAAEVNAVLGTAVGGAVATTISDGARRVDVSVRLAPEFRDDPEQIGRIPVPTPDGTTVPLSLLAEVASIEGPVQISRENGQRRITVQANARGRDLGSLAEEVQRRLDREYRLPTGYRLEFAGTFEHLQSGRTRLALVTPLTFALIFLLLYSTFGSVKQAALVFTGIPLAVTGGVLALYLRGMPFSIPAGIGFIALAGIAVLNGVVMVTFINELRRDGKAVREAILEGAVSRLRPVLMTAAVAGFGFVPMAFSQGAGAEVQKPLATVVIGGLISATLLTLAVLPTLYALFERDGKQGTDGLT
jgi:cobalt-zinc-cadmium resistance protein CzcA